MTVTITPTVANGNNGLAFAGHAFDVGLRIPGNGSVAELSRSAGVTIHFSQADVAVLPAPAHLILFWWNGLDWIPARDICAPTPPPTLAQGQGITYEVVCETGRYALFGPTHPVFLPNIVRE